MEFLTELNAVQVLGLGLTILWGIFFGVENWLKRVSYLIHGKELVQATYGIVLDMLFMAGVVYYGFFVF